MRETTRDSTEAEDKKKVQPSERSLAIRPDQIPDYIAPRIDSASAELQDEPPLAERHRMCAENQGTGRYHKAQVGIIFLIN